MTQVTHGTGCFLCGKPIHIPAEKWVWMGATGQKIELHTECVYCCAAVLRFDAEDLAIRADTGGRFN